MKRKIYMLLMLCLFMFNIKAYAVGELQIEAKVNGTIAKGEQIEILINIKDIKSFFAGQVDFRYDTSIFKIKKIEQGDLISKSDVNKFEAINKIDEASGTVSYAFSCLGKVNGFSGTGTFVKITAEVLKNEGFSINSKPFLKQFDKDNNMKLIICDSDIKELEYKFTPYQVIASGTVEPNTGSGSTSTLNTVTNTTASDDPENGTNTNTTQGSDKVSTDANTNTSRDNKETALTEPASDNGVNHEKNQDNQVKLEYEMTSTLIKYVIGSGIFLILAVVAFAVYRSRKFKKNNTEM